MAVSKWEFSMVNKMKAALFATVLALFGVVTPVFAQSDTSVDSTTDTSVSDDKAAGREARIQALKDKATAKLEEAQEKRIAARCKNAQSKVTSLRARVTGIVQNRKAVYQQVGEKLDVLLEKLKAAELDTMALETAREDMRKEIAVLVESLNAYDTALADIIAMDCESDPETFHAALLSARDLQNTLRTQSQEFRSFATNELKTILQDVRAQLEAKKAETSTESVEGDN
ncbi:hypothetical protein KC959_03925 [Candidatus Saccharibacteria bacterium]|nr:hypothetical protein [Candidatus Saccharibacteria bacterium]